MLLAVGVAPNGVPTVHLTESQMPEWVSAFDVVEAGRRFLEANDAAAIAGGRPTDPDVAYAAGVPVFDPEEALRTALQSRDARNEFREALAAYDEGTTMPEGQS